MENPSASSSSSRAEAFPAGLRVLVVDDDPTWLKILEKMLRKCSYEVTTCGLARVALDMLRERRDRFDIVISDVNMPDMDGFKLLEHVGLEMDLPVIMMSVDGETSRVMKGVQHGACDYLLKPVRMKELRNIWQHVFRKKIHEIKEVESHDGSEEFQFLRNRFEEFEERQMLYGGDLNSTKKRKDVENRDHFDPDFTDPVSVKKARVVWTVDLHQKFVNAVNQIGFDKVGPKKILDLMNVPGLTRENVASHLQKYRLYLSRLQKQNDGITFGGAMPSDLGSKDPMGNFCLQSSKAVARNVSTDSFAFSAKRNHVQGMKQEVSSDELKSVVVQTEDSRKVLASCSTESQKAKTISQLGVVLPPKGVIPSAEYKPYEPTIPNHHCWSGGIPAIPFTQYSRQDQESFSLATDYQSLQRTVKEQVGDDHFSSTPSARTIIATRAWNESGSFQIKPVSADYRSNDSSNVHVNSVPVQVAHGVLDSKHIDVGLRNSVSSNMKGQYADHGSLDSPQKNNLTDGSTLSSSPEDLLCSLDGYDCFENVGLNGTEVLNYDNSCQMTEPQSNLYDGLQLDCEYVFELMKYPTIGGGLFT